ncbi:helix-turn-helix domain-containing protein [Pedobacter sp. HMF7647]|uniref:Helix-turn-helix domain-containing protein n=1 Tax=Hufsiella arboris TaxID=2695275 RepID=A0A7K1Y5V9_9SPHI|nr:helix-turn-helix transcriptional regulator [Hufsiella arboris]MXV49962.1 helix-turn-helix domain-containing protein [Hufsiella arboris]
METTAKPHIGRKISRIRELRGMKQDYLATELGVSQQTVSRIEASETVEEDMLKKIADVLGVSAEAIHNFSEEVLIFHIQNMHDQSTAYQYNYQCEFNPISKVVELYERLVQAEKDKVGYLEKLLEDRK